MIVYCGSGSGEHYASTEREIETLIDQAVNNTRQRSVTSNGFEIVPERVDFSIVKGKYPEETDERWPTNYLYVSVNSKNGYGALRWWTNNIPDKAPADDPSRLVWTSKGEIAPPFDPELIADPGGPRYYSPAAAIPLAQLRKALEEFCRLRTGERPTCISWQLLEQFV